ncbi:MAG: transporter substrate-binding domain-containing protein [Candidatus Synoicihabitans palmerolidicus]|nr:transporter substrate-binding domain-containing protein [Candidatus Synoicihabitans palmerolidicus]
MVGTREAPPCAIKNTDGTWSSISIELWNHIADEIGVTTEWREMGAPETLIDAVAHGSLDVSIAAITADRAQRVDFSQPFYSSGLGIVVPATGESG